MKSATFRSYWNLEAGVSFIPWDMIKKESELAELGDGSWIDPKTCPSGIAPPALQRGKCTNMLWVVTVNVSWSSKEP